MTAAALVTGIALGWAATFLLLLLAAHEALDLWRWLTGR
jgi:hypothetical protein